MILLSEGNLEKEKEAIMTLKEIGAEGLLIFPVDEEQYNEEILSMKFAGFPFVLIDRYLPGVETNCIAICSDSPLQTVTMQERIDGYMNALIDPELVVRQTTGRAPRKRVENNERIFLLMGRFFFYN
jgi:GntR family transcriptional regulator of arabinose operon